MGVPVVRSMVGTSTLYSGQVEEQVVPEDYVALDIQSADLAGNAKAVWTGLVLMHRGSTGTIRVAYASDAENAKTVTLRVGDAPLVLQWKPEEGRRYVYLRAEDDTPIEYEAVAFYEIRTLPY